MFKSLNLIKLKDIFKLSVLKLYFKFKHNLLPVYTLIRNPYYDLPSRARGALEFVNPCTVSGERCLRCYLPNFYQQCRFEGS